MIINTIWEIIFYIQTHFAFKNYIKNFLIYYYYNMENKKPIGRPVKYNNDADRHFSYMQNKIKYNKKPYYCEICDVELKLGSKGRHDKTKKHKNLTDQ
jgi:hypothetical protein